MSDPVALHPARLFVARDISYPDAEAWQKRLVAEMAGDPALPGAVIFAEHQPVITCGRSGDGTNLLASPERLAELGIAFHRSGRGGDVTYHGPGQWTVYPILRLDWYGRDLHRYLRLLEECVVRFLAHYGIIGTRRQGLTGVWVDAVKVAAEGVAVTRWIAWHGFALNINPDLSRFTSLMHPCGIAAATGGVASLETLTGRRHDMDETLPHLRKAVLEVMSLRNAE